MRARIALLSAGGTGGHLFPAEALGRELIARGWEVHLATDTRAGHFLSGFDDIQHHEIPSATPSGASPLKAIGAVLALVRGTGSALRLVRRLRPSVFVGFGGYPTTPPGVAAALLKVPVVLHEANATLGRANRFLARFAAAGARSLPGPAFAGKAEDCETGNPVREAVLQARKPFAAPGQADPFKVLVFGGSQGARVFSHLLPEAVALLNDTMRRRIALTLQVREEDRAACAAKFQALGMQAELAPFFQDLPERIADAHLVIARSGASTVSELAVLGRPSLLVPYPYALDHDQAANAAVLAAAGGAEVVAQHLLTPQQLADRLATLAVNPQQLETMAAAAAEIGRPDATGKLADLVIRIAKPQGEGSADLDSPQ